MNDTAKRNQCQWTIEIRAHVSETEREAINQTMSRLARHADATVKLLPNSNIMKPETVCYGDDFFVGHFDVAMLPDEIGNAIADVGLGQEEAVSDELLQAARDMAHDKAAK
jgi:hypothetical protein